MRLAFIEPQLGASYADQLAVARRAEECGFDGFFRSDHYLTMGSRPTARANGRLGDARRARGARPRGSGSARSSRRPRSAIPGRWRSRSRRWMR
jgi:hypothetical protein